MCATKQPVAFRIRTHAQFERCKQARGSAMTFAVPIQWLRLSFVQTCVAGYLKARAASQEEIGTRTTRLTCVHVELILACVQLFLPSNKLSLCLGGGGGCTQTKPICAPEQNRQLDTQASTNQSQKSELQWQEIRDLPLSARHFAWTGMVKWINVARTARSRRVMYIARNIEYFLREICCTHYLGLRDNSGKVW